PPREHPRALRPHPGRVVPEPRRQLGRGGRGGRDRHRAGVGALHGLLTAGLRAQRDPAPPRARGAHRRAGRRRLPAAARLAGLSPTGGHALAWTPVTSRADATSWTAEVRARTSLSEHLLRLELGGPGLAGFASTGIPDEWVPLVVPGQFQSRYYTVRSWDGERLVLDVVV